MAERSYKNDGFELVLDSTDPTPLADETTRYTRCTVQNAYDSGLPEETDTTLKVGGEDPILELVPGQMKDFEGFDLKKIYVQGAIGLKVKVYLEQ